jgi:hypothetical protein
VGDRSRVKGVLTSSLVVGGPMVIEGMRRFSHQF